MQIRAIDGLVGQMLGSYHIERLLGQSRLNAVYLARDQMTRRVDALTLYRVPSRFPSEAQQRFLSRFLQEAASISSLQYRFILPVHSYGEYGGNPYLVTPYMTSGSLSRVLKQKGRFSHTEALEVLEQVANGLEYAHRQGMVHGTLRPANIVLADDKRLLVAGFGLLRMLGLNGLEQSENAHLLSISGAFLASPEYIAPEMVQNQKIDARTDIYALGAILFEMLGGKPPFSGPDPRAVARQHIEQPAPSLRASCPDVPVAMESVINQALERDPARRFQRIEDLVEAYAQVSVGASGHTRVVPKESGARPEQLARQKEQETPSGGYNTAHWQLNSSSVTGGLPIINPLAAPPGSDQSGAWQIVPPIVTGKLPVIKPSQLPTGNTGKRAVPSPTSDTGKRAVPQQRNVNPAPTEQTARFQATEHGGGGMRPFDWWSMPGPDQELPPGRGQQSEHPWETEQAARPAESASESQSSLLLRGMDNEQWGPMKPLARPERRQRKKRVSRRTVVSLLATGGVIAAGVTVALNLGRIIPTSPTAGTGANNDKVKANTTVINQKTTQKDPGAIGGPNMAANSSLPFVNPADKKPGLLIHLPDGRYVAYQKACTHEDVAVHYDPGTHTLVCPLHGSIFDPANGGKVLMGPATIPLPAVKVHVLPDGVVVVG